MVHSSAILYLSKMNHQEEHKTITDLRCYQTWMGTDGIARSVVKPNAEIELDDAIANTKAVNDLYLDKKFPLLVDANNVKSMSREARKYHSVRGRSTNITAFAVIVKSPISKVIGNFFFQFQKTGVPAKLFSDEESALKWLEKHKTQ